MIAYLEPAQFIGIAGVFFGLGILTTRTYDAIRKTIAMRRIRREVTDFAAAYDPATMDADAMMHHRALGYHPRDERCAVIACTPVFGPDAMTFVPAAPQTSGPEVAHLLEGDAEPASLPERTTAPRERNGREAVPPARSFIPSNSLDRMLNSFDGGCS